MRKLAALQALRIVLLHEAFAARIDQAGAVRDRDVVARKVELLHQHVEGAAERELHVDQPAAGAKRHRRAVAAIIVDAVGALHRDHAGRYDRPLGFDDDETAGVDVKTDGAGDAGTRRPFAVGGEQLGDEQAVEDPRAACDDLAAKLAHRDLGLVLHAADVDHAATGKPADLAVGVARDWHVPADVVLDALALALEQLVGPALVAHVAAADDELLRPGIEVVAVERTGRDAARHRRCAAAADIGLVDQRDGGLQVRGAKRGPASGETASDDQDVRFENVHACRPFHQEHLQLAARCVIAWERRPPAPSSTSS